jgi:TolB-like protein
MKKFIFLGFALFAFLLSSEVFGDLSPFEKELTKIATEIAASPDIPKGTKLAVLGFQDSATKEQMLFSSIIEDDLAGVLIKKMRGRVIAKNHIETVLKELKISKEDVFDQKNRKEFGKLLAADFIVTGSYWIADELININIVVVDIENGLALFSEKLKVKESSFPNSYFRTQSNNRNSNNNKSSNSNHSADERKNNSLFD